MNTNKVRGKATGVRVRPKIERWVKFTYRLFLTDGTSKYMSRTIGQFKGRTSKELAEYLVRHFTELLEADREVESVKLISVDGDKYNITIS